MDRLFSKGTLDFLFENRLRDSREWFLEHQAEYRALVREPLGQLVEDLSPAMLELDPEFITQAAPGRTISRIRRDTRFSRDPSLYRDHMWIIFKRGGKMHGTDHPGVYFEINQEGFSYGCGFYHASTAYMACLRERVLEGGREFQAAQKAFLGQQVFRMEGECFKRSRYGSRPPEEQLWLERRNISFNADSGDFGLLFSPQLPEKLAQDLRLLFPVYRFLESTARETLRRETERELSQR